MKALKSKEHFKLLTPAKDGKFYEDVISFRKANGNHSTKHLLSERLVLSFIAFRSQVAATTTISEIASGTRLHRSTVRKAVNTLHEVIEKEGRRFLLRTLPEHWFATWGDGGHWYKNLAYTMFYLPSQDGVIKYSNTTRRFGLNHALLYSWIINCAKDDQVKRFTNAGAASFFRLNSKTVASVVNDLHKIGFIKVFKLARAFDIQLQPLNDKQLEFFESKPTPVPVEPVERKRPTVPNKPTTYGYQFKGDWYDEWREHCQTRVSQATSEKLISMATDLGEMVYNFQSNFDGAWNRHQQNVKSGKVGRANFDSYILKIYETRHQKYLEQVAEREKLDFLGSAEGRAMLAKRDEEGKASVTHDFHIMRPESIIDRVKLKDNRLENYREAEKALGLLHRECRKFLDATQARYEPTLVLSYRNAIMVDVLKPFDKHYGQESHATKEEFSHRLNWHIDNLAAKAKQNKEFANA